MKTAHYIALLWTLGMCVSPGAGQSVSSASGAGLGFVAASKTAPGHVHLLEQRRGGLIRVLSLYNYDWGKSWYPKELQSTLLNKVAIFRCEYVGTSEGSQIITVTIPISGGSIRIIPLSYGMLGPNQPEEDPHNIAIFNELILLEQPEIRTDADRLNLAQLYLHLFYEAPMILERDNLTKTLSKSPKHETGMTPSVKVDDNGKFDIELVQKVGIYGPFLKISFSFDKQGMLHDFYEEKVTEAELLNEE